MGVRMSSSRVTHVGASFVLGLMLTAGLASSVYAASPTGPKPGPGVSQTATHVAPAVAYHISGKVTGNGSAPLANISVTAESSAYSNGVASAADGTYSIPVPAGTYTLYLNPGTGNTYLKGYYSSSASGHFTFSFSSASPITIVSGDATGKDVQIPLGYTISGTVTGTGAVPLSNIRVEAYVADYDGTIYTTSAGKYSTVVPPSNSYTLKFSDPTGSYLYGYYSSGASGHFTTSLAAATLVPVGTSNVTGKDVQMEAAPPWSVTLTANTTHATVGTSSATLTAAASEDVGPTSYWIVILDSHNNIVKSCGGGTTCVTPAGWTNTVAGPETYHAVVANNTGGSPIATSASRTVTWTPGTATHLTVSTVSAYAAGAAHTATVTALDAYDNTATGYLGTVHFTSSDAHAVLPANATLTSGVGTFTITLKTAGSQAIRATDTVTSSITGLQSGISVTPGPTTALVVSGLTTPTAGAAGTITVTAEDAYGNTTAGYLGTVHFTATDAAATLPANHGFTAGDAGVHSFSVTLKTAGAQAVRARDTSSSTITGVESGIVVKPAAAKTLVVSGLSSPRTAGVAGTVTVTAKDAYGNTATGYRGTVTFTSVDTRAVLPANYTFTAANAGVHTFSVTLKTAGSESVRVADTVTSSITGGQYPITVNSAAAATLVVSGIPSAYTAGGSHSVTVTARDAFGNTATGYRGTIHFTSTDLAAILPADYKFTSADGGVHVFLPGITLKTAGDQAVRARDTVTATITGLQDHIVVS